MKVYLKGVAFFCGLVWMQGLGAFDQHVEAVMRHEWPQYVNGTNLLALSQVSNTVARFDEVEEIDIMINYPGGDVGRQWAITLSTWFVSFGIPQSYLRLQPGSGAADRLIITLTDRR